MKKYILLLIFSISVFPTAYSQIFVKLENAYLVEKSLETSIFLLRQEYQLEDTLTHKRYTLDNRSDFGSAVSFAVLTETGYIVLNDIVVPWEKDSRYEPYKGKQYRPVLSRTLVRTVKDSAWRESALISPLSVSPMKDTQWVEIKDSLYAKGLVKDCSDGKKDGWAVWLASAEEHVDSSALSLIVYRQAIELSDKDTDDIVIKAPDTKSNMLGGLYMQPCFDRIGQIVFKVCGIVVRKEDSWVLVRCLPDVSAMHTDAEEPDDVKTPVLTPLDDGQGPKAEDTGDNGADDAKKAKQNKKRKK